MPDEIARCRVEQIRCRDYVNGGWRFLALYYGADSEVALARMGVADWFTEELILEFGTRDAAARGSA